MANPGENARRKLIERERKQALAVVAEFRKIQKRIEMDLFLLLQRIEKARQTEGNAPPALLFEQARLRDLLNQVSDEIFASSIKLGIDTAGSQRSAIATAKQQNGEYAELETSLNFFDSDATRRLIGIAGDGQPLAKHFARLAKPARQKMFDALFYGVATGKPNAAIAREVKAALETTSAQAMTIVRTETNRAYREATRMFYQEAPAVVGWRWLAALDLTTCPVCWAMHGKVFKTKTAFGTHPNCRCTMVPVFATDPKPETGSRAFAALTIEQQRAILGPKRLELYNQGAGLSDFVETYRSPFGVGRRIKPIDKTEFKIKPRTPAGPAFPPPSKAIATPPAALSTATPPAALTAATPKPGDPVPSFKTPTEATAYFEQRYPDKKFDFEGIDTAGDFLNNQTKEIARLLDAYPETAARLKYFGTYTDKAKFKGDLSVGTDGRFDQGEFGHCATTGRYIALNPSRYRNAADFRAAKKRHRLNGWSVTEADQGTVTHEFGHAVEFWIDSIGSESLLPFRTNDGNIGLTLADLKAKIRRRHKPKRGEQSDYSLKPGPHQKYEQWAEGFSMRWNRPAAEHSRYSRHQTEFIDAVRNETRYDRTRQRYINDLPEAERRDARRQINDLYSRFGLTPPYKKRDL